MTMVAALAHSIADSRLLAGLGWIALHLVWQGALAALIVRLALRSADSPRVRHAIALSALIGCVLVIGASLVVLLPAPASTAAAGGEPRVPIMLTTPGVAAAGALLPWLGVAWLGWMSVAALGLVGGYARAARWRESGARDAFAAEYAEAARRVRVRNAPPLRVTASAGPAVVGCANPTVVVPHAMFDRLSSGDRVAILAHELAHVRRRDPIVKAGQSLAMAALGFHPALRSISRVADREREKCCDDIAARALDDNRQVARALARIALARAPRFRPALSAASGALVERIERLALPADATRRSGFAGAAYAALAAAALLWAVPRALEESRELLPARAGWSERVVFQATDPAGEFTLAVEDGRATAATLAGVAVPAARVRQLGQWVTVLDPLASQPLHVRVVAPGRIEWRARAVASTSTP